jgi:hypothetical protein
MKKAICAFVTASLSLAGTIRADFLGYYSFPDDLPNSPGVFFRNLTGQTETQPAGTWSIFSDAPGSGADLTVTPGTLSLDGGAVPEASGPTLYFNRVEVTDKAPAAGFFSFDFTLSLGTANASHAYYLVNGTRFALSAGSGSVDNVSLNQGDIFGFGVDLGPNCIFCVPDQFIPEAVLQVTNFSAPVPEPAAFALLVMGALIVALAGRRWISLIRRSS